MVTGFFKKLKNKLFNSSSKFTKNLDEAVNEVSKAEVDVNIDKKVSVEKSEKNEINTKKISESEKSQFAQDGNTDQKKDIVKDGQKVTNTKSVVKKALDLLKRKPDPRKVLFNDEFLEKLEDILISSDVGSKTALKISEKISSKAYGKKIEVMQLKEYLIDEITKILEPIAKPIPIYKTVPQIVVVVGVNGSGKTTFAGLCFGDLLPINGCVDISISGNKDLNVGYLDQFPEHLILLKTTNELVTELKENQIYDSSVDRTFKKRLNRFGIQWDYVYNKKGIDLPWAVLRIFLLILFCHCCFDVLILDEPTFGLGWDQRVKLRSFIRECMSHLHFMIVSHDKVFIRSICQQVIDLDELDNKHVRIREKETTKP